MQWEQQDLGALGLAGICRETSRVVRRANFANWAPPLLSALFLVNAAALRALSNRIASDIDDGAGLVRLVMDAVPCHLLEMVILVLFPLCTTAYVLCVASLYRTGGDLLAAYRVLKEGLRVAPIRRLPFPVLLLTVTAALLRLQAEPETVLPLRLLGLASAAYVALEWQLAWVVSVLEDATLFSALRRSRELLAGKFWAAACVLVTLDGCIIAVLMAFTALVVDDALDLGPGMAFQVAVGVAMFVALYAVFVVVLVAQPVVYLVCKSHQQMVVDKAHLA